MGRIHQRNPVSAGGARGLSTRPEQTPRGMRVRCHLKGRDVQVWLPEGLLNLPGNRLGRASSNRTPCKSGTASAVANTSIVRLLACSCLCADRWCSERDVTKRLLNCRAPRWFSPEDSSSIATGSAGCSCAESLQGHDGVRCSIQHSTLQWVWVGVAATVLRLAFKKLTAESGLCGTHAAVGIGGAACQHETARWLAPPSRGLSVQGSDAAAVHTLERPLTPRCISQSSAPLSCSNRCKSG